ncbi:hypothetical protein FRC06_010332 [Ceratobasidium sp. 370]|nr:hypothetical protein FRC06_010332 [Ceratobasidium sp. 370]
MSWRKRGPDDMDESQRSPSRRRTYDYSHQPEQGLQEWASRIRSIQAEVDRDEEAEQKRLEEEIAASRLARAQRREAKRRSSGLPPHAPDPEPPAAATAPGSPGRSTPASLSLGSSRTRVVSPGLSPSRPPADPEPTTPDSPTKPTFGSSRTSVTNPGGPGAPMSLAAFIGGRATGPRLNKPAPQVDSHDPTLFDQTPRTGVSAAAVAFKAGGMGSSRATKFGGGITLPGLGSAGPGRDTGPSTPVTEKPVPRSPRSPRSPRAPAPVEPPPFVEHTRKRTLSSPTKPEPPTKTDSDPFKSNEFIRSRRKSTATSTPSSPPKDVQGSPTLAPAFSTPPPRARTKSSTTPSGSPFSSGTPSTLGLARAIQPTPPPQDANKFPLVTASSHAFRSTQQSSAKELSPSLTRLQGRGFVGKVKQAAESSSPNSSLGISSSQFGEREREKPKRGNVQERWQMAIQTQIQSQSSPLSPSDIPAWKRRIAKEPVPFPSSPEKPKPTPGPSNLFTPKAANRLSGRSASPADEFGRRDSSSPSPSSPTKTPEPIARKAPPSGLGDVKSTIEPKPLSHLTRDRARKPKKNTNVKEVQWETVAEIKPSTTPVGPPPENRSPSPFRRLRPAVSNPSIRPPSPTKSPRSKEEPTLKPQQSPSSTPTALPPSPIRKAVPIFTPKPEPESKGNNVSRVKDMWAERAPIGVKVPAGGQRFPLSLSAGGGASAGAGPSLVGKRALPGMAPPSLAQPQPQPQAPVHVARPEPQPQTHFARPEPQPQLQSPFARPESPAKPTTPKPVSPISPKVGMSPASPGRHARTPSTGNRATVMEVAQAMMEKQEELVVDERVVVSKPRLSPGPPSPSTERRRSSFERYSGMTMPTLKEEKTPVPTPAGTISKRTGVSPRAEPVALPDLKPELKQHQARKSETKQSDSYHVDQTMAPIPPFNLQQVLNANPYIFAFPSNLRRISTDVFTLSNGQAALVSASPCIVYESELVAVVQRVKNERNGLVQNKVWGWQGKRAEPGAKEETKLGELAKQYGTTVVMCVQGEESEELVDAVGGHWVTRQGSRAHWTPENTTMHCTRQLGEACFIDEVDFHVSNLCSAYSYCITALDAVYVWHGRGSTLRERDSAARYAKSIAGPEKEADEFDEGKEDPMFFMLLGEDPWANADYWKYRALLGRAAVRPRMFCIDAKDKKQPASILDSALTPDSIVVLDGIFELFVLVGPEARARRTDILLGVHVAISIVSAMETQRPFTLPVHLVVLPSQMPLDLRAGYFRFLEDERVNTAGVPSHMNLLTLQEASEQLSAATWPRSRLQDHDFLPLGLHPSQLS